MSSAETMEEKSNGIEMGPERHSNKVHYAKNRDPVAKYISDNSLRLTEAQEGLIEATMKDKRARMLGSADELQFLQNLCRAIGAKKTLDVGVYTGYSSLSIALAIPEDGKVIALDIDEKIPEVGRPFWKQAGVEHKIDLRIGPAAESLSELMLDEANLGTFDFAFIDADKGGYDTYYEACLKLLRKGGIIAIDNMLWSGRVCTDEDQTPDTVALRNLAKKIHKDERVDVSLLTAGDGTTLAFKR